MPQKWLTGVPAQSELRSRRRAGASPERGIERAVLQVDILPSIVLSREGSLTVRFGFFGTARRLLGRLRDEAGQSLVLALVVLGALTVGTAGIITFMTSNEKSFTESIDANRALSAAEAGLQNGISVITQYDSSFNKADGTVISPTSFTTSGGSGTWWAVKEPSTSFTCNTLGNQGTYEVATWAVSAIGTSPDGSVSRNVQERVQANPTCQPSLYNYALYVQGGGGGCTSIGGSGSVDGNIWIGNNLCLSGNTDLLPPTDKTYTLYVNGYLQTGKPHPAAGSLSQRFLIADIHGGCEKQSGAGVSCSDYTNSNVFAYTGCGNPTDCGYNSNAQTGIKPSGTTLTDVYTAANWLAPTCTGTPPTFESSATPSANPSNTVTIDQNTYDCTFTDGSNNFVGHIAYDSTTNTLTASGEIFIDGNLSLTNSHGSAGGFSYKIDPTYWPNSATGNNGGATIYVNGTVTSKTDVCGPSDSTTGSTPNGNSCTNGPWTPLTRGALEFVAMNVGSYNSTTQTWNPSSTGWTLNGNGELDANVWVDGAINATGSGGNSNNIFGSVIVDSGSINGGGGLEYPVPPPSTAPTNPAEAWQITPSSWRQCGPGYTAGSTPTSC